MVKYKNLEGNFRDLIVSSVDWALQNLNQIPDKKLRNCIKKRLKKTVYILIALIFVIGITIGASTNVIAQQTSTNNFTKIDYPGATGTDVTRINDVGHR